MDNCETAGAGGVRYRLTTIVVETREVQSPTSSVFPIRAKFSPSAVSLPDLGATLQSKRLEMGLTWARMAEYIGVLQMTARSWETGEETPRWKTRKKLAKLLGNDLFGHWK